MKTSSLVTLAKHLEEGGEFLSEEGGLLSWDGREFLQACMDEKGDSYWVSADTLPLPPWRLLVIQGSCECTLPLKFPHIQPEEICQACGHAAEDHKYWRSSEAFFKKLTPSLETGDE